MLAWGLIVPGCSASQLRRGDGPRAALLQPPPSDLVAHVPQHGDAQLFGWVAGGFPQSAMPAFRGTLTEAQIWDVLNYLRRAPAVAYPRT